MQLTAEQENILNTQEHLKINAVAGSGKTTTIVEFARTRPPKAKILYLGFNKSVKLEAQEKFRKAKLYNVTSETAHSLAYRHIMHGSSFELSKQGYKIYDLAKALGLNTQEGERYGHYVLANHINKFFSYFCNSNARRIDELNYVDTLQEPKAKKFAKNFKRHIYNGTLAFWQKMEVGEIAITHDFYLKKFQLSNPKLPYDYILFDEGQDASPAMLDVFLKQKAIKIIVGDEHQQIYGWRHAVNSLAQVSFKAKFLTNSFRFGSSIAQLANHVLGWKKHLDIDVNFEVKGKGNYQETKTKAVLARTNLGLLLKAIEYVSEKDKKNLYFEGNIHSYTYADDGTSLYDVLNLYLGNKYRIKDALIKEMRNMADLDDYIESTQDLQLAMMVEVVKQYGEEIPELIKEIKARHIEGDDKSKAEIIFSTVHRSKGMEYDQVQLVDDFLSEERLLKKLEEEGEMISEEKLNEEINLLYVAVTRAKVQLFVPDTLFPHELADGKTIRIYKTRQEETQANKAAENEFVDAYKEALKRMGKHNSSSNDEPKEKAYSIEEVREKHNAAYTPWTQDLDEELTIMYCEDVSVKEMALHFGRTQGAIRKRIKKLELKDLYEK